MHAQGGEPRQSMQHPPPQTDSSTRAGHACMHWSSKKTRIHALALLRTRRSTTRSDSSLHSSTRARCCSRDERNAGTKLLSRHPLCKKICRVRLIWNVVHSELTSSGTLHKNVSNTDARGASSARPHHVALPPEGWPSCLCLRGQVPHDDSPSPSQSAQHTQQLQPPLP